MEVVDAGDYSIHIGTDALKALQEKLLQRTATSWFLLVDANTRRDCLPLLLQKCPALQTARVLEVPAGESCKTPEQLTLLWSSLLKAEADRDSELFVCGGGAVCDLGSFAASTYHRGIAVHLIPTSLLSMVDASVGGKTAINLGAVKNPVGTFALPESVYIDPEFLQTLPLRELRSGMAEVFKHACLSDHLPFPAVFGPAFADFNEWTRLITDSVAFKVKVVAGDLHDRGQRQSLNFGHTLGHAIEALSLRRDKVPLLHGEAVALGLVGEIRLSCELAALSARRAEEMLDWLSKQFGDLCWSAPTDDLLGLLRFDKKRAHAEFRFSLLRDKGLAIHGVRVSPEQVRSAFAFVFGFQENLNRTA
jgi:3-dehydroquinate synthase